MALKHISIETIQSGGLIKQLNQKLQEVENLLMSSEDEGKIALSLKLEFNPGGGDNPDIVTITSKINIKTPDNLSGTIAMISRNGEGILVEDSSYDVREPGLFPIEEEVVGKMRRQFPDDTFTVTNPKN